MGKGNTEGEGVRNRVYNEEFSSSFYEEIILKGELEKVLNDQNYTCWTQLSNKGIEREVCVSGFLF